MGFLDLIQRIRARTLGRRRAPKAQTPAAQTWEDFNEPNMEELITDIREQSQEAYEELQQSLRNPN